MMANRPRHQKTLIVLLVAFLAGITFLAAGCAKDEQRKPEKQAKRQKLSYNSPSAPAPNQVKLQTLAKPNYKPLRDQITAYLAKKGGKYSFYLYDLNSGGTLDINSRTPIAGASTTKWPIVLYFYNQVAQGKINLNDSMVYNASTDYQTGAGAMQFFAVNGLKYRYRTLANFTVTLSDNVGKRMLVRKLGQANIAAFMRSLGGETVYPNGQNVTTARDMVTYIRATLDFQKRNQTLGNIFVNDLSNTIWDNDGIPAKLPGTVQVAHKVGTITGIADDAGIVYLKGRPYALALLTDGVGPNIDVGFAAIGDVSRMVYDFQAKLPKAP